MNTANPVRQLTVAPLLAASLLLPSLASAMEMDEAGEMGMKDGMGMKGEMGHGLMLEYRYMDMLMDGNRDGTEDLSTREVTDQGFMMASPEMRMEMHMLMGMYRFTPRLSGMLMLNYLDKEMEMVNAAGVSQPTMSSEGLGDTRLGVVFEPMMAGSGRTLVTLALSLPTGSIDETGRMMANPDATLPYPMQLGSGTYDLVPKVEYRDTLGEWRWGASAEATVRLGRNDEEYSLGDRADVELQAGRNLARQWEVNAGVNYHYWGNVDGQDSRIMTTMSPYGDPDRQGGKRADVGLGLSYALSPRFGVALDYQVPFYEDLDGPQMSVDRLWSLSLTSML